MDLGRTTFLDFEKVQVMQIQFQKTSLVEEMFHQSGSQISVSNQGEPRVTMGSSSSWSTKMKPIESEMSSGQATTKT